MSWYWVAERAKDAGSVIIVFALAAGAAAFVPYDDKDIVEMIIVEMITESIDHPNDHQVVRIINALFRRTAANFIWYKCITRGKERTLYGLLTYARHDKYCLAACEKFFAARPKYKDVYDKVMLLV